MTTVTGKLETITGNPSRASGVWVRATHSGPAAGGVITEEQEPVTYTPATGMVSFTATAGTSGVLVVQLHGRAMSYPIIIPDKPTATLQEVVESAHRYPPVVVAEGITAIREARDQALAEVQAAVTTAVTSQMKTKADKTQVEQLAGQVMATMGIAGSALHRTKT